jgi:hypothetical protein
LQRSNSGFGQQKPKENSMKRDISVNLITTSVLDCTMGSHSQGRKKINMPITNLTRSSTVLLAGFTLAAALNLYCQSNSPHSVETLMQKLTHRPAPPNGLSHGIWDATAEYTDLNAYTATAINDWGEVVGYACMPTPQCVPTANNNGSYL